jgi:hypothetical protein
VGVPEVERTSTGVAVASTVAVVVAVVARSEVSTSDAVVSSHPEAEGATSTVAVTGESADPAAIGAVVEVQVRMVSPALSEQLQPVTPGAESNVSPDGRVAVRVGSPYAGPAGASPSDGLRVRLYLLPTAAPDGVPVLERMSTGVAVARTVAVALAVVAASALSASDAAICRGPEAVGATSTVAVTSLSVVPAVIGASVEVQVSTAPPPLSEQFHPVALGAAAKVSPDGRVAERVGSL